MKHLINYITNKVIISEILILIIIGLTPLLWFSGKNDIVIGHDSGFPLEPIEWTENRFHTWNSSEGWGKDNSMSLGTVVIHLPEYIPNKLGFDIYTSQKIAFIFWSQMIVFSMYGLLMFITKGDNKYAVARISSSSIYLINYYTLQAWFIAERTKFSILIALPLVVLFLLRAFKKKNYTLNGFLAALVLTIFNGGGSAFTLYGGLILVLIVLFISLILFFKQKITHVLKTFFVFGITFLLLNAYWILPQIYFSLSYYNTALNSFGGIEQTIEWAKAISKNSNIINVLRLQGIPAWYDDATHPYSNNLLNNPVFQIMSWIIPVLAFLPIIIYRKNKNIKYLTIFLVLLSIVSILFTSGMHFPFGIVYEFLLRHVPFFTTFRTPFYKFGYALWFAYSILIGLSLNYISIQKLVFFSVKVRNHSSFNYKNFELSWKLLMSLITFVVIFIYTFPYFQPAFFNWTKDYSTKLDPPDYIFEYQNWANSSDSKGITLLAPQMDEGNFVDKYDWGYLSIQNLPSILSQKPTISNSLNVIANQEEKILIESLYLALENDIELFDNLSKSLNIDSVLIRKDATNNLTKDVLATKTTNYINNLSESDKFEQTEVWGEWILYERIIPIELVSVENSTILKKLYTQSNIDHNLIDKLFSNFGNGDFTITKEYSDNIDIQILDSTAIKNINQTENTITYEVKTKNRENSSVIHYKKQPRELTELIVEIQRIGNKYNIRIREPQITIKAGAEINIIKGESFETSFETNSLSFLSINDYIIDLRAISITDQYNPIGQFTPKSDKLELSYFEDFSNQIVSNESFENKNWSQLISRCGGESNKVYAESIVESNNTFVRLNADESIACIVEELKGIEQNSILEISLDTRSTNAYPRICLLGKTDNDDSSCIVNESFYDVTPISWSNYKELIQIKNSSGPLLFHLYADSRKEKVTIDYDNLSIASFVPKNIGVYELNKIFPSPINTELSIKNSISEISLQLENIESRKIVGINNASFEFLDWDENSVCGEFNNKKALVQSIHNPDSTDGKYSLEISSSSGIGCYIRELDNFTSNRIYDFSIDYKNLQGTPGRMCLLQFGDINKCLPEETFDANASWETKRWFLEPLSSTDYAVLHLYSDSKGEFSSNLYDNIQVFSVSNPFSFFAVEDISQEINSSNPQLNVKLDTPSMKLLEISNPKSDSVNLSFKQTYSDNWLLIDVSNPKEWFKSSLSPNNHMSHNVIFNSWSIDGTDKTILLIYKTQIIYIFSIILGLLTLMFFIIKYRKEIISDLFRYVKIVKNYLYYKLNLNFDTVLIEP